MVGIEVLKQLDKRQLWRLFIDGRFHKKYRGWVGYENQESGSTQGMINAYTLMLKNFDLSNGISCHYIRNLHHTCMFNVESTLRESSPGDLRCEETGFKFFSPRTTIEFLKELFEIRKDDCIKLFHNGGVEKPANELNVYDVYKKLMKRKRLQFNPWYPTLDNEMKRKFEQKGTLVEFYEAKAFIQLQFAKKMESIVNKFNQRIKTVHGEDAIIEEIARFVQEIELLHPFPDGNCRTFLTLTNHLLLYHGLYPTMIENPNYDGTYSYKEYAYEIKKGIACTKSLLTDSESKLYGFSVNDATEEENATFVKMADKLIQTIDRFTLPKMNQGIYLTPEKLTEITQGKWLNYNSMVRYSRVGTHSDIGPGYLSFCVALPDWRKEGVPYEEIMQRLALCVKKGVHTLVVDKKEYAHGINIPVLVVPDVTAQLRKVAMTVREEVNPKTVLVGGTVGKTGFKIQLHNALSSLTNAHAILNSGNIKLPILYSLSSIKEDDKVEIVEVSGAAKFSWGASRSKMVAPDICVFTDINQVHMDIHKSVQNLITNKASAVEGLRQNGKCIINAQAVYAKELIDTVNVLRSDVEIVTFGEDNTCDAYINQAIFNAELLQWEISATILDETITYAIPLVQSHAPLQSVGVLLAVKCLGYDIQKASKNYLKVVPFQTMGRLFEVQKVNQTFRFYDQSLRGSLAGMCSALDDLKGMQQKETKVIALLGGCSIEEDGEFTKFQHEQLAQAVNTSNIDILYTTGPYMDYFHEKLDENMKSKHQLHSDDRTKLVALLSEKIEDKDLVFVMGSAYLRLGEVGSKVLSLGKRKQLR